MAGNREKVIPAMIILAMVSGLVPVIVVYTSAPSLPNYEFIDTSVALEDEGIHSFAAYESEDGITIIGGSPNGMLVYRLWGNNRVSIFPTSSGIASYDMTEWSYSTYTVDPSVVVVKNRTPIIVGKMTEHYWTTLFTIDEISIDDTVQVSSNPSTTLVYVSYRHSLYVYNHRGEQVTRANLTALLYAPIESLHAGSNEVVVATINGFGVFDPVENTTMSNLDSPTEIYRARPAITCNDNCETIYVGRKDGLYIYERSESGFTEISHLTKHQGLPADSVTSLWLDSAARRLYIGTEGGLIAYDTAQGALIQRQLITSEVCAIYSRNDVVLAASMSGVYAVDRDQLENQLGFSEATYTFLTGIYMPALAYVLACSSILMQLYQTRKAAKKDNQPQGEE